MSELLMSELYICHNFLSSESLLFLEFHDLANESQILWSFDHLSNRLFTRRIRLNTGYEIPTPLGSTTMFTYDLLCRNSYSTLYAA